jgi:hypothetical protein
MECRVGFREIGEAADDGDDGDDDDDDGVVREAGAGMVEHVLGCASP